MLIFIIIATVLDEMNVQVIGWHNVSCFNCLTSKQMLCVLIVLVWRGKLVVKGPSYLFLIRLVLINVCVSIAATIDG